MNEPTPTSQPTEPEVGYVAPPTQVTAAVAQLPGMSRQALIARIGLLGIAAATLVAVAILTMSSTAAPNGTLAAGSNSGAANDQVPLTNGGGPGFRGGRGPGAAFGDITITAINGNSLSLKTEDGWTRTISVDSGTTYSKAGATIALGDLKVGDQIAFRQTLESSGTWSIDSITVILPRAGGQVTKVEGSTITVTQRDGSTATITVNGQTTYSVDGTDGKALSDVKVGMFLVAEGTKNSDGSLTAATVRAGTFSMNEGPRGFGHGGFPFGEDHDGNGQNPSSTAAPSATSSAS